MKKENIYKLLFLLGLCPFLAPIIYYFMLLIIHNSNSLTLIDLLIMWSFVYWPIYLIGIVLLVISIYKLKKDKWFTYLFLYFTYIESRGIIYIEIRGIGGVNMPIDKGYISGSSRLLVLKLLNEKPLYGYELIKTLKERSNDTFDMKEGTLYPILHKLENDRLIKSSNQEVSGRVRKVYSITTRGVKVLEEEMQQWNKFSLAVNQVLAFKGA